MIIDKKKCMLCEACQLICEKGAIHFEKKADGVKITIHNSLCEENCTKCIDICFVDAIKVREKSTNRQENVFIKYLHCDNCGSPTIKYNDGDKNLCKKCKKSLAAQKLLQCNGLI